MLTPRQLEMRKTAIGGSEIAVLANLSKWSTPIDIYNSKVFGVEKDESLAMDLGVELEAPICNLYGKRKERRVFKCDSVKSERFPYAIATPDRAVFLPSAAGGIVVPAEGLGLSVIRDAEKLLEAKSTNWRQAHEWGAAGTDEVPDWVNVQCQWTMGTTGLRTQDVAVLFDANRFEVYQLVLRPSLFEALYEIGARYMVDHVLARKPPPADASEGYGEFLKQYYPKEAGKRDDLLVASAAIEEAVLRYGFLKKAQKRLKAHLDLLGNQLRKEIGPAAGYFSPRFGRLTWVANKPTQKINYKAIVGDLSRALGDALGPDAAAMAAKIIEEIMTKNTKEQAPIRPLRLARAGEAKQEITRFALELPALGEEKEEEEAEAG